MESDGDHEFQGNEDIQDAQEVELHSDDEPMSEDEEGHEMMDPELQDTLHAFLTDDSIQGFFEHKEHKDSVVAVAFSHNGQYVAVGSMDGTVMVYMSLSAQPVVEFEGPSEITWLQWHPRGDVLIAGSEDGTLWMWNVATKQCMHVFTGHTMSVTCGTFTPDGKRIVSGSEDGSVLVFDPKNGTELVKFTHAKDGRFHDGPITALAVSPDNQLILSGSQDGSVRLLGINGKILAALGDHEESVESVAFCEALPVAVTSDVSGRINLWEVHNYSLRQTLSHEDAVTKVKFLKGSHMLYSASLDKTVKAWDIRTGNCERTWRGHQDGILDFDLTAVGKVVTGSDDGNCLVFAP